MKIRLVTVGKTDVRWVADGLEQYMSRLVHYAPVSVQTIPQLKDTSSLGAPEIKKREGQKILEAVTPADTVVLLDERGKEYRSVEFAARLEGWLSRGGSGSLVFVIGGAYGFSEEVYSRANSMLALSRMTFSHQEVRVLFAEQLYRAFTILRGEPYHNE